MSNYPILYENIIGSLTSEVAKKAFLWCADSKDDTRRKYPSETYAREVDILASAGGRLFDMSAEIIRDDGRDIDTETLDDLMRFILKRHANWRLGGNTKMWWEK